MLSKLFSRVFVRFSEVYLIFRLLYFYSLLIHLSLTGRLGTSHCQLVDVRLGTSHGQLMNVRSSVFANVSLVNECIFLFRVYFTRLL